jgi:hypothetical protein
MEGLQRLMERIEVERAVRCISIYLICDSILHGIFTETKRLHRKGKKRVAEEKRTRNIHLTIEKRKQKKTEKGRKKVLYVNI